MFSKLLFSVPRALTTFCSLTIKICTLPSSLSVGVVYLVMPENHWGSSLPIHYVYFGLLMANYDKQLINLRCEILNQISPFRERSWSLLPARSRLIGILTMIALFGYINFCRSF